ncbi:MAG: DUF4838 domain-containing protein, partial [Flavobacteriaceae bacterium]|nr:DUF4838 domain-containing protein [Flavobacteriaceae bacterium]
CEPKLVAQKTNNSTTVNIYVPSNLDKDVTEAIKDMEYWLKKAGVKAVSVANYTAIPNAGIRLVEASRSDLPNLTRAEIQKDGQSFQLLVEGLNNVQITGTGKNSFINGIYTFLHELGFRWYMPGDNWIKIGDLKKLQPINKIYTPDFPNRFYAGSGGAHAIPGIDPQDNFSKELILWNRRNRVSFDYVSKGHSGMNFYSSKKAELDKHPEYFCNNKITRYTRLNIDNKDAVNLFVDWALEQVKPEMPFPVIGVDPADGAGGAEDCLPATIPLVKTWSDKYFWLANKVSVKLPESDKKTRVQLYAYNNHAAPPNFSLDDNVYPVIIPYAFQNVSEPEEFIDQWSKTMHGKPMGIYDYWNITQWSKCLPQFNIYVLEPRLRLWKKKNITSIQLESTYAKGPMGHVFWIAMQMMWDTRLPFDELYKEFLSDCFSEAAPDIKKMYDRWSTNYQGAMEAPLSDHDLAAASAAVKDKIVLQRISELKAYVHYIKMYEDYSANMTVAGYTDLINYIYGIHHMGMLHTSALQGLYIPKPKDYKPVTDKKVIEENNKKIKILQQPDIENIFQNDLRTAPSGYAFSKMVFDITKAKPLQVEKIRSPLYINNVNVYSFYLAKSKEISIQVGST